MIGKAILLLALVALVASAPADRRGGRGRAAGALRKAARHGISCPDDATPFQCFKFIHRVVRCLRRGGEWQLNDEEPTETPTDPVVAGDMLPVPEDGQEEGEEGEKKFAAFGQCVGATGSRGRNNGEGPTSSADESAMTGEPASADQGQGRRGGGRGGRPGRKGGRGGRDGNDGPTEAGTTEAGTGDAVEGSEATDGETGSQQRRGGRGGRGGQGGRGGDGEGRRGRGKGRGGGRGRGGEKPTTAGSIDAEPTSESM